MKAKRIFIVVSLVTLALFALSGISWGSGTVYYKGQGFTFDGTTWIVNDERCGLEGQYPADDGSTGQFADWNGPGQPYQTGQAYLVWVLTVNGATSATLYLPDKTVSMYQVGGTYKYVSGWYDPEGLIGVVYATWAGGPNKAQLTVSHGCAGFTQGAWCSPGFWKNAGDAAWTLIGISKDAYFNQTVVPDFYATASSYDPTLWGVLTYTGQGGANHFGAAGDPYGLNAYNATGAFLSDNIPGYTFDPSLVGDETACPIDAHGAWK
jgi:hypothetical protein